MPFDPTFRQQVQLLVSVLPLVAEECCFALKSGTAINLFVRDLPRLSVRARHRCCRRGRDRRAVTEIPRATYAPKRRIEGLGRHEVPVAINGG